MTKSEIFTTAWVRVRNTGCTIGYALKRVYGSLRCKKFATVYSSKLFDMFHSVEKGATKNNVAAYSVAQKNVVAAKEVLRNMYKYMIANSDLANAGIITCLNTIASIVKSLELPSIEKLYKAVNTALSEGFICQF
jgi:hypothetical protein